MSYMNVFLSWNNNYPRVKSPKQNGFLRWKVDEAIADLTPKETACLSVSGNRDTRRVVSFKMDNGQTIQVIHNFNRFYFQTTITGKPVVEQEAAPGEPSSTPLSPNVNWLKQATEQSANAVIVETAVVVEDSPTIPEVKEQPVIKGHISLVIQDILKGVSSK